MDADEPQDQPLVVPDSNPELLTRLVPAAELAPGNNATLAPAATTATKPAANRLRVTGYTSTVTTR